MRITGIKKEKILFLEKVVCEYFGITRSELRSKSRKEEFLGPRNVLRYLARKNRYGSYKEIGRFVGCDHASVINAYNRVQDLLDIGDKDMTYDVNTIANIINNNKEVDQIMRMVLETPDYKLPKLKEHIENFVA